MGAQNKVHIGSCDRATESDNNEYWTDPICNATAEDLEMTESIQDVTCKNCLRIIESFGNKIDNQLNK